MPALSQVMVRVRRLALVAVAAWSFVGAAQAYPDGPVHIVVPFAPGGATDQLARLLAEKLSPIMREQFVVENKPGANTILAATQVARGKPDGQTLFIAAGSTVILSPLLYKSLPFDPARDFNMLAVLGEMPLVLVVSVNNPIKTLPEFLDHARNNAGKLNFGSPGTGSTLHMAGELLKQEAGISATHAAYKISSQAMMDLIGGSLDFMMADYPMAKPELAADKIRPLAVTSHERLKALPDIPALNEIYPGFLAIVWYGLVVQKATPEPIVRQIKAAVDQVLADPSFVEGMTRIGFVSGRPMTQDAVQQYMADETKRWSEVITSRNIKIEP